MGTVPIVIFRGLRQSRAQGLGELGTPHFPGYSIDLPGGIQNSNAFYSTDNLAFYPPGGAHKPARFLKIST